MITILNGGDLGGQEETSQWLIGEIKTFSSETGTTLQYRKDTEGSANFIGYIQ
jgi:hypothetical protein